MITEHMGGLADVSMNGFTLALIILFFAFSVLIHMRFELKNQVRSVPKDLLDALLRGSSDRSLRMAGLESGFAVLLHPLRCEPVDHLHGSPRAIPQQEERGRVRAAVGEQADVITQRPDELAEEVREPTAERPGPAGGWREQQSDGRAGRDARGYCGDDRSSSLP